jgi:hypothetical protein
MTGPADDESEVTISSEIPCRVSNDLPLERAISLANPANNGELLASLDGRRIPWEVESHGGSLTP